MDTTAQSRLEELYTAFSERLNRFVQGQISDRAMAEDIVHDVFASLAAQDVATIDNASGWLYRVTRNAIIDHRRSATVRREMPTEASRLPEQPDQLDEDDAIWDEIVSCLSPFLAALAPAHREALELTDLGGLTQAEAAAKTGLSVAGMKSRVQRARAELLQDLHDCCTITSDARGRPIEWKSRS